MITGFFLFQRVGKGSRQPYRINIEANRIKSRRINYARETGTSLSKISYKVLKDAKKIDIERWNKLEGYQQLIGKTARLGFAHL
jgi:hypothetical protein